MNVIFLGAGPGDPDLLTVKAARLLQHCQCCIYAGSLVSQEVIDLIPASAATWNSAHMTLEETTEVMRDFTQRNIQVIRLHTGDPSIYGAIGEQMAELNRLKIPYSIIPGVSSFQAAAAAVQTELTAPEIAQSIILTRAAGRTPVPHGQHIEDLAQTGSTLCIFLSIHQIHDIAATIGKYHGPDCPMAVVFHASWPDELVIRGTAATIAELVDAHSIHKTAIILAGRALTWNGYVSKLYDASFTHGYRNASQP